MEGETVRCAANPQPATTHLPGEDKRSVLDAREQSPWISRRLGRPMGTSSPPRAVPAMNGQLGCSGTLRHPPPTAVSPSCCRHRAGRGRNRGANKPQGTSLTPAEGAEARRTPPPPDPGPQAGGRARGARPLCSRGSAGGVRAPESLPRPYLLFHVPQQLFFDCVLCAAHGAAGGGRAAPSGPEPRAPSPPPRLPTQRPTREAEPPPAALPACCRCSHCPALSSAAIFRAPQTSGSRPGPFPQRAGRGCVHRDWGGGVRAGADAGGVGPRRAPQARLSWRPAVSRPEGANPHCERGKPASRHALRSGRTLERCLRPGRPQPETAPDPRPLREERGGRRSGSGSPHSSESRGLPVGLSCKACGRE